jgi:hypothetical protein
MWRKPGATIAQRLKRTLERGISECLVDRPVVWFRADDVAVPSRNLTAMLDCFRRHTTPLALAVVPSWLSASRWRDVQAQAGKGGKWCFHQHGRRHVNHEPQGKKSEFGPFRPLEAKIRDIQLGKKRLEQLLGANFFPVFTAPWNRFDTLTGNSLAGLGFLAASRNDKAFLRDPIDLPEVPVNCDLHTRRGTASQNWSDFFSEMEWWLRQGLLGIMLHHQRMNAQAFDFLDVLLSSLRRDSRLCMATLDELVLEGEALRKFQAISRTGGAAIGSFSTDSSVNSVVAILDGQG